MTAQEARRLKEEKLREFAEENTAPREMGVISRPVLKAALSTGVTFAQAGTLAGSLSKNPSATVSRILEKEPELKQEVINAYKRIEEKMLASLEDKFADYEEVDYDRRVAALAKITASRAHLENPNGGPASLNQQNIVINISGEEAERARERIINHGSLL